MTKNRILMITTNNLEYDTRILNEAKTLSVIYAVTILTPACNDPIVLNNHYFMVKEVRSLSKLPKDLSRFVNVLKLMIRSLGEKTDIYHAHDLPGLCCAYFPSIIKNKTLVYDSHELWRDVSLFGVWKIFRWPFKILERLLITKVKGIITVNDSLAKILKKRYHKPTQAIYNYPLLNDNNTRSAVKISSQGKKIALYLGALQGGRGLAQIIEAAKFLSHDYQIVFIGYGRKENELKAMIAELKLDKRVSVLKAVHPKEILAVTKQADLGLCLIENASLSYYYSTPNKLFQYIASEVPVLGSNFPEFKKIILGDKIGEVVNPTDPELIASKIKQMTRAVNQKKYRKNLKNLAKRKYDWDIEAKKLVEFYQNEIVKDSQ